MVELELRHRAHKVGVNVHHFEWCTKYRYKMFRQEKYRQLCEEILRDIAEKHGIVIREMGIMPEHIHTSVEIPPSMAQSKALQLLKGGAELQVVQV